jgi:osmotically-inducible protein OsmY
VGSTIDGVKSFLNSLRIKPDLDEDRQIRLGIEQLIEIAGLNETNSVMVDAKNGVVTIKGLVSTRKGKNAIQTISENRPGVAEVKNLLTVRASAREDMVIQKDVFFICFGLRFLRKTKLMLR